MGVFNAALTLVGSGALLLLGIRCLSLRHWRTYPYFCLFLACVILRSGTIYSFPDKSSNTFYGFYWYSDLVVSLLSFIVAWEVFRHLFPVGATRSAAGAVTALCLTAVATGIYLGTETVGNLFPDFMRKLGFAVAVWLVTSLGLAQFFAVPPGRNIRAMAIGLGIFHSLSLINMAAYDLAESYVFVWPYWRRLSFVLVMFIWTWGLWRYAPCKAEGTSLPEGFSLSAWEDSWRSLSPKVRRTVGL